MLHGFVMSALLAIPGARPPHCGIAYYARGYVETASAAIPFMMWIAPAYRRLHRQIESMPEHLLGKLPKNLLGRSATSAPP